MRSISTAVILTVLFAVVSTASAASPERSKGISMHMLPKRVADLGVKKWGLVVSYAEYLKAEKAEPALQSTTEFLAFVRKQDKPVQENGAWIVTTHPDAYSEPEKKLLEDQGTVSARSHSAVYCARFATTKWVATV